MFFAILFTPMPLSQALFCPFMAWRGFFCRCGNARFPNLIILSGSILERRKKSWNQSGFSSLANNLSNHYAMDGSSSIVNKWFSSGCEAIQIPSCSAARLMSQVRCTFTFGLLDRKGKKCHREDLDLQLQE